MMNYEDDDNSPYLNQGLKDAVKVIGLTLFGIALMIWVAIEGRAGGW